VNPQYVPKNQAVTSGSAFITWGITLDPALRQKTTWVVITMDQGSKTASLYRFSGKAPGLQSRDIYAWNDVEKYWRYVAKDEQKHASAPQPPHNAICTLIEGVDFWTMTPPTEQEKAQFKDFLAKARPNP
jgi:hypothetical protein